MTNGEAIAYSMSWFVQFSTKRLWKAIHVLHGVVMWTTSVWKNAMAACTASEKIFLHEDR